MAESNRPQFNSVMDRAPLEFVADGRERPGITGSVEQLLNLHRVGVIMTPDPDRPEEAWGVLNPASARSRQDELYLFPRVVAQGNYSRIGIARVDFDAAGNPTGVERLGLVLEPHESYEHAGPGVGGVEDPRISYLPLLDTYVMSYTALGPLGARIALAISKDLHSWNRLGLLQFEQRDGIDFGNCDNKDCVIFPLPVTDPTGHAAFALLHRPIYGVDASNERLMPPGVTDPRPSIWISYVPVDRVQADIRELTHLDHHQLVAQPMGTWEHHHIGAGAPPILSEEGWLLYYHGVLGATSAGIHTTAESLVYQSGVMLLDRDDPRRILYRSFKPVLQPQEPGEQHGIVPDVVFPTAVDVRGERIDVYYGAADERIAAATTEISASVLLAPSAPSTVTGQHHIVLPGDFAGEKHWYGGTGQSTPDGVVQGGQQGSKGATAMYVKDIMSRSVEAIEPTLMLTEAAARMQALDVGMLAVQAGDEVVGVITDRDVATRGIAQRLDTHTASVSQAMTRDAVFCYEDQTLEEAAAIMADSRIPRLLVLDQAKQLRGMVSLDDVARAGEDPTLVGETLERTVTRSEHMTRPYGRILVALDGSTLAERVLDSVAPLAQKFGSKVTLLRVATPVEAPQLAFSTVGSMGATQPAAEVSVVENIRREAMGYLAGVEERLEQQGLLVESECLEGPPSDVILRRARQLNVDLIALTTHGRTGVDRLMLGSVAEDIVRRTPCPVHLVRVRSSR